MAKKVTGSLKLEVPAGAANPSPPIGPALGQRGLNIMEFCKSFNAASQAMEKGMPVPVVITIYSDKSFTYQMKTPPAAYFLRKAAKIDEPWRRSHGPGQSATEPPQRSTERRAKYEGRSKKCEPLQKNLWANSCSGNSPSL